MVDRLLWAALGGGLVAGTLDIGAAALVNAVSPLKILLVIASGVLGKSAYQAGVGGLVLGLALQWIMSLIIAALYVAAWRWVPLLRGSWIVGGVLAGVIIFVVMNFVVVPLSAAVPKPQPTLYGVIANVLVMIAFGLIIAFAAYRYGDDAGGSLRLAE